MNLANNLENSTRFFPNKPAIREGELELTYAQFNDQVNHVATGLIKLGIKPGDLIGLCAPNSADWLIYYFGVIKAGAVAVTLFSTMTSGELNNLLNHAEPRMLFTTPDRLNDLEPLKTSGMLEKIFCSKESEMTIRDLIETGSGSFKALDMQREDIGAILYTGGTTGVPKGCMLTHEHLIFSSHSIAYYEHSSPNDFALCLNPFNHVFGQLHIMNPTFYSAGCLEIPKANDTESILRITESGRVTKFYQVPTVYVRLLKVPDLKKRLGNISYCFSGGASMAREVVRQWKEITGITIAESHGMTEFMPITFNHYPK
jgi:long-chain acyl-CoA synthetase